MIWIAFCLTVCQMHLRNGEKASNVSTSYWFFSLRLSTKPIPLLDWKISLYRTLCSSTNMLSSFSVDNVGFSIWSCVFITLLGKKPNDLLWINLRFLFPIIAINYSWDMITSLCIPIYILIKFHDLQEMVGINSDELIWIWAYNFCRTLDEL